MAPGPYSRRLQAVVKGRMLKEFDSICVRQEYNESEGIREAIRLLIAKHYPPDEPRRRKKFESRFE